MRTCSKIAVDDKAFFFALLEYYCNNSELQKYSYFSKETFNSWHVLSSNNKSLKNIDEAIINDGKVENAFKAWLLLLT